MIDSFSWKHWKDIKQEPDWANLQIEVVDVWHFVMSLAIENYSKTLRGGIEDLAINISNLESFSKLDIENEEVASEKKIMLKVEDIMREVLSLKELELEALLGDFFDLVIYSGLDLERLYKLYVGKNILNQFRQDHGYKEGTYIKDWAGEEDNVIMKKIWEDHADITPDRLYKELTKLYFSMTKS